MSFSLRTLCFGRSYLGLNPMIERLQELWVVNIEAVAAPASMQVQGGEAAGVMHGLSVQGRHVQRSL